MSIRQRNNTKTTKFTTHQFCKMAKTYLGKSGDQLVKWVNHNCLHRGTETTVTMMKDRWNYIQHLAAKDLSHQEMKELAAKYRIGIKRNLLPKGFYGELAHNYLNGRRCTRMRLASILKAYTMIEIPLTPSRLDKILDPIRNVTVKSEHYPEIERKIVEIFEEDPLSEELADQLREIDNTLFDRLDIYRLATTKSRHANQVDSSNTNANSIAKSLMGSAPTDDTIFSQLLTGKNLDVNGFPLSGILKESLISSKLDPWWWNDNSLTVVPKPGAAGRVIAKMNVWDQLLLIPYHDVMDRVLHSHPSFYHRDQWAGADNVMARLNRGEEWAAADLSNATDTIPRSLFTLWCKRQGLTLLPRLIDSISTGNFSVDGTDKTISYAQGQPMGLYASFHILQICNYMLYKAAYHDHWAVCDKEGIEPTEDHVFIVGDDIVLPSRTLPSYKRICNWVGVPINDTKCFSNKKTQFCGFEIDNINGKWEMYRPFKFKPNKYLFSKETILPLILTFPMLTSSHPHLDKLGIKPSLYKEDKTPWLPAKAEGVEEIHARSKERVLNRLLMQCSALSSERSRKYGGRNLSNPDVFTPIQLDKDYSNKYELFESSDLTSEDIGPSDRDGDHCDRSR